MSNKLNNIPFGIFSTWKGCGLFVLLFVANASSLEAASLTGFSGFNQGIDVSADGNFVAGNNYPSVFRQDSNGNIVNLGYVDSPGYGAGHSSSIGGMSSDGSTIAGYTITSGPFSYRSQAFVWKSSTGISALGDTSYRESAANAVSADGTVIAGWINDGTNGQQATLWKNGVETVRLDSGSTAAAISQNGLWLGGYSSGQAFVWSQGGGVEFIGSIGSGTNIANAVSDDGSRAAGQAGDVTPFIWDRSSGMQSLGTLSAGDSGYATGMSGNGTVVVGSFGNAGAFIWTEADGLRSLADVLSSDYGLNLTGWNLRGASNISADGSTIVGYGFYQDGSPFGPQVAMSFVAVIPEPSAMALLLLGLGFTAVRCRGLRSR